MFITRTKTKVDIFYLDNKADKDGYDYILNTPGIVILNTHYAVQTETNYEGESSSTISRPYVRVEYQECSL